MKIKKCPVCKLQTFDSFCFQCIRPECQIKNDSSLYDLLIDNYGAYTVDLDKSWRADTLFLERTFKEANQGQFEAIYFQNVAKS